MASAVQDRRARIAVAALFLTNGALFTNLLPRYPELKADLGLSNTGFGLSVAAFSAGALLSGLTAGALIRRFGSARVALVSSLIIAIFTLVAAVAPTPVAFGAALFVAGAADWLPCGAERPGAAGAAQLRPVDHQLAARGLVGRCHPRGPDGCRGDRPGDSPSVQLCGSGLLFAVVCLVSYHFLLPGPDSDEPDTPPVADDGRARGVDPTYLILGALAVLAIAGAAVEDAGSSWATLYLHGSLGAPAALAAFGFIALVGFQFIGRLLGDRLVDRFGECGVARAGGLLAAVGMGAALAYPNVPGTIAGFAAAGLGVATVVPAAFHRRQRARPAPGHRPDLGDMAHAGGIPVIARGGRNGGRRGRPARRAADRARCRNRHLPVRRGAERSKGQFTECTEPMNSMVTTPAMISAIPAPINQVNGSANRNFARTATSATPQADQTP